jgi:hypothetical protein
LGGLAPAQKVWGSLAPAPKVWRREKRGRGRGSSFSRPRGQNPRRRARKFGKKQEETLQKPGKIPGKIRRKKIALVPQICYNFFVIVDNFALFAQHCGGAPFAFLSGAAFSI